jgi:diadenosine tetraphosphate (Ap4A) HIT family hydrolase
MSCELCDSDGGRLLWRGALCRVVLVEDPDYPGFCRVILNRHVREMTDLPVAERRELMETVFAVEQAIRTVLAPDKVNLASLGNLTPHLHWHVIPRYIDDRHYPNPIWGASQRAGRRQIAQDWEERLVRHLTKLLACGG